MTAILLIEDDHELRTALAITLRSRGHHVIDAATGRAGLDAAAHRSLDVVVMDLGLPDIDGLDVIKGLRGTSTTPIIVLSARRDEIDKVRALDAGADDYVTKPFGVDELLARIRAAVRRTAPQDDPRSVATDDFVLDLGTKTARTVSGAVIHLTPTEWAVLETLIRANGLLVSTSDLLTEVWGPGYEGQGNYLRVYVGQLRRKLEPDPANPRYLITSPGMGYRFSPTGRG